jgi:hypothetical protein
MHVILGEPRNRERFDNRNELFTSELWFYDGDPTKGLPPFFYLLFFKPQDVGEFRLYSPALDTPGSLLRGNAGARRRARSMFCIEFRPSSHGLLTFDATAPVDRRIRRPRLGTELMLARIEESRNAPFD